VNLRRIEYIATIAEEGNIAHAADRLFVSRTALNHYLIDLEKEIGAPLFKRIHKKLLPTHIGHLYVNAAKQILGIKKQLYKQIEDIADSTSGSISLGVTHGFGINMLKNILSTFLKRYPSYKLDLLEGSGGELEHAVEDQRIDFAIVTSKSIPAALDYSVFSQSELLLILPPNHPLGRKVASKNKHYTTIDLSLLKEENFILLNATTYIRAICNAHFDMAGYAPKVLLECSMHTLAYDLVLQGLGASIILLPHNASPKDGVHRFSLEPQEIWTHSVRFRKGTLFSKAESYFIELARDYYQKCSV
jgi:DNA-binding transcriptional LysR family regulator